MTRPRVGVRVFVGALFALMLVPGLIGFEAWPLTAWRLFSADRGATQDRWEIDAVTADGTVEPVDLDELSIAYRNAEWILAELPESSSARWDDVCVALLGGVREARPDAVGLELVRNQRHIEERDGEFVVVDDREPVHTCGTAS